MRSVAPGSSGRDGDEPQPVEERLERRSRHVARDAEVAPGRARRVGPGARNGPSRLNPSGSAPSVGASGQPGPDALGERGELVERRGHGGRQERGHAASEQRAGHAVERGAVAHRVVAAPAVDVDVDEARRDDTARPPPSPVVEVDRGDPPVLDRDPAGRHPIVEDQATADGRGRRSAAHRSPRAVTPPVASAGIRIRSLDVEADDERRSGRPGSATRSPRCDGRGRRR